MEDELPSSNFGNPCPPSCICIFWGERASLFLFLLVGGSSSDCFPNFFVVFVGLPFCISMWLAVFLAVFKSCFYILAVLTGSWLPILFSSQYGQRILTLWLLFFLVDLDMPKSTTVMHLNTHVPLEQWLSTFFSLFYYASHLISYIVVVGGLGGVGPFWVVVVW